MTSAGAAKRTVDVVAALAGITLLAPLGVIVAFAIRSTSRGPAIFAQERVGQFEESFTVYKFRTMTISTHDTPTHLADSSSVTRVGRFLRRTKLDELPQLWNVLRGEMSLVGPRPCLPMQTDLISARRSLGVHRLRPGITGPAQLAGIDMSQPERLAAKDATYIENRSLLYDVHCILSTAIGAGTGDPIDATSTDCRFERPESDA